MTTLRSIDSPWRRLPWTLPAALLLWAVALWGLACFMGEPVNLIVEQPTIDAQLIEQPVLPMTQSIQPKEPVVVHQTKALPQLKPQQLMPQASPRIEQSPIVQKTEVLTSTAVAPGGSRPALSWSSPTAAVNPTANNGSQTGPSEGKGSSHGNMHANSGARAIVKPMPQIPDDMRDGSFDFAALARFHIATDGSVTVELAKPTPNPRLNRILLNSLNKWRFIPAIKNGKPVASTEEIVVKMEVK